MYQKNELVVSSESQIGYPQKYFLSKTELYYSHIMMQENKYRCRGKQHLKLVKEIQIRNYDGLIGHNSLVIARYNILSLFQREGSDQRSFGDLFRVCNEELANISFIDALKRIMQLAMVTLRKAHKLSDKVINSMLDVIMGEAVAYSRLFNCQKPQLMRDLR